VGAAPPPHTPSQPPPPPPAAQERQRGYKKKDFIQAKYDFVEEMLKWSGAQANGTPATILDVGCGIGGTSRYLAAKFPTAAVKGGRRAEGGPQKDSQDAPPPPPAARSPAAVCSPAVAASPPSCRHHAVPQPSEARHGAGRGAGAAQRSVPGVFAGRRRGEGGGGVRGVKPR
jgi:hypothetical protein